MNMTALYGNQQSRCQCFGDYFCLGVDVVSAFDAFRFEVIVPVGCDVVVDVAPGFLLIGTLTTNSNLRLLQLSQVSA